MAIVPKKLAQIMGSDPGLAIVESAKRGFEAIYSLLITRPLRKLYFEGPVWKNQLPEEICFQMTGVSATHWAASEENMRTCYLEMEKRFRTWDTTVMSSIYFLVLAMVITRIVCCCSLPRLHRRERLVSPEELRMLIQEISKSQAKNL
jgi:hypothetical protein